MKLLRKLEKIELKKQNLKKQSNGMKIVDSYSLVKPFEVCFQDVSDNVSISAYGAEINSIKRISSIRNELELFLLPKMDSVEDNISKYVIFYNDKIYKIKTVKHHYIDIQSL